MMTEVEALDKLVELHQQLSDREAFAAGLRHFDPEPDPENPRDLAKEIADHQRLLKDEYRTLWLAALEGTPLQAKFASMEAPRLTRDELELFDRVFRPWQDGPPVGVAQPTQAGLTGRLLVAGYAGSTGQWTGATTSTGKVGWRNARVAFARAVEETNSGARRVALFTTGDQVWRIADSADGTLRLSVDDLGLFAEIFVDPETEGGLLCATAFQRYDRLPMCHGQRLQNSTWQTRNGNLYMDYSDVSYVGVQATPDEDNPKRNNALLLPNGNLAAVRKKLWREQNRKQMFAFFPAGTDED